MELKIVVVGCGAVALRLYRTPLQMLERRGLARVVGLVDSHHAHARNLQSSFPRAAVFDNLQLGLEATSPTLTLVLTPAHLHAEHSVEACRHNSHVLCEKPMAMTAADCEKMISAAAEHQRVLAIGMVRRFFPAFFQLRSLIQADALGNIESFEYREGRRFDWEVTTPAAFRPRHDGGTGVLFDIGPHAIDLLIWLFGPLMVKSYADDAMAGVDANVFIDVQPQTSHGSVHLSWDSPLPNELRITGSKMEAVLRTDRFDKLALNSSGRFQEANIDVSFAEDVHEPNRKRCTPRSYAQAVYCQLIQMLRAIQLDEPAAVDGVAGMQTIRLLESALSVAQPLPMPWLNAPQRQAYRTSHWTSKLCMRSQSLEPVVSSAQVS